MTVLWQEPVSAVYARIEQGRLDSQLDELEGEPYTTVEQRALTRLPTPQRKLGFRARALDRRADDGDPLGPDHPAHRAQEVFVAGTDGGDLRKGPGHYPSTPLPGDRGTVAIAGHRTTYGAPFRKLDKLRAATGSICACRTGTSPTGSSAPGSCRRPRPG